MAPAALLAMASLSVQVPVWSDEFNGTRLDPTKWEAPAMPRQGNSCAWDPKMVEVRGGHLRLKVRRLKEGLPRYITGAVRTQAAYDPNRTMFQKSYGRYEARVKLFKNLRTDAWFAFWIMAGDIRDHQTDSRLGSEIDIMESFFAWKNEIGHAVHWGGYGPTLNSASFPTSKVPGLTRGGWHTYGLIWTPRNYVFTIDGREVLRTNMLNLGRAERVLSKGPTRVPGYLKLTTEAMAWSGPTNEWETEGPEEDVSLVDWVRVYDL
ncbi:MAG: glycoside hydrolase family 16 protein [Fimbriimonadaceae bacterium]|nr:glycoside hydrolase family 16 protein [Fimbriimonadaceae bacterium]